MQQFYVLVTGYDAMHDTRSCRINCNEFLQIQTANPYGIGTTQKLRPTVKHEIFVARNFRGFQIFIISLHVIFAEFTIYNMGYITAVKFCCM